MKTDADRLVENYSDAAESMESMRKDIAASAITTQREKEEAIANIYEMAGGIKATTFFTKQSKFLNLLMLKKVKDSKEYREKFGMSWEGFCEHAGVNRRWVDDQLADLKPFKVEFLEAFLQFSGVPLSKVKYLAEKFPEVNSGNRFTDNAIIYNGETIPLDAEHKDDIQAIIENLEAAAKAEKEELTASLSAQKKVAEAKEKLINNMEKELKRLEKTVVKTDLTPDEQDAVNLLALVQADFMRSLYEIRKKIQPRQAPEIALRQLYYLWILISKVAMEERIALQNAYADAEQVPWEITEWELPPPGVLVDNLPMTAGLGVGHKLEAVIAKRNS